MLIIEGSDKLGKTTLAHAIVKEANSRRKYPALYGHFTKLPDTWDAESDYRRYVSPWTVMDRFHMSDPVYRAMDRGRTSMTQKAYKEIDQMVKKLGGFTVLMTCPEDELRRRWKETESRDEMYDVDKAVTVNALYGLVMSGEGGVGEDGRLTMQDRTAYKPEFRITWQAPKWPRVEKLAVEIVDRWHESLYSAGFNWRRTLEERER